MQDFASRLRAANGHTRRLINRHDTRLVAQSSFSQGWGIAAPPPRQHPVCHGHARAAQVRFHIIAEHILCEEVATIQDPDGFNSHLNVEQLNKCLVSLFHMYDKFAERGCPIPSEPEMRAYMILLQLDRHGNYDRNTQQARARGNTSRCFWIF